MSNLEVVDNYKNGPDQVIPASSLKTWDADGATQLSLSDEEAASFKPISVYTMLKETAENYPNHPALAVKRGVWKHWTYKEYFEESKAVAKAFIKLGLDRFHGICIMGFNSPEWAIANYGAVFAGGLSAGVYTTNSPEACRHLADNCDAQIIVVEDVACLNKFLAVKRFLPSIKAIIQWSGAPCTPGVLSWTELLAIGLAEKDTELNERLSLSAVNQCCTLIYTSGTTGPPKGVMCSQDHLIWASHQYKINGLLKDTEECMVSYLPLSHLAAHLLDIYISCVSVATVYFAQPDALKGSLLQTLLEVQPTRFLGVPRVWEKMYEKMQEAEASVGGLKKKILLWAKYHGLNYYNAIRDGRILSSYEVVANSLAKSLIINKVKAAIGLSRGTGLISESMSICSMNKTEERMFKLGSVGKILPQTTCRLEYFSGCKPGEGEILIKGRNVFMGYLKMPEKTNETIDDEGWMCTGDIGSFNDDGFLYITGRIKELVITAGGENIPPLLIEDAVKKELPFISNAMLVGDRQKYLSILLTLKTDVSEETGEPLDTLSPQCLRMMINLGLPQLHTVTDALRDLEKNPQGVLATAIQEGIHRYNDHHAVSRAQKVQRWMVLPHDFSLPTGELNNTLKLKRSFVMEKYSDTINSLYSSKDPWENKSKL
ncbi:long-chain-fatty-acid--CoA ligase ACSBG2-like isoform X2 [Portunus trituberculatus]|uniref:long-chain-fatty-acid--CoA ligase ACSBG2-like isoform X2 n=1 Tax=Portunus trituberculatus TaxID=210409 RepID=UPI001E1CF153|nr:long-chain-fatty-acid--CoA ligase ACSBG2-like isoform X2 [Portunus trituberculatus]